MKNKNNFFTKFFAELTSARHPKLYCIFVLFILLIVLSFVGILYILVIREQYDIISNVVTAIITGIAGFAIAKKTNSGNTS